MYEQKKNDPEGRKSKGINWTKGSLLVKWDGTDQAATYHRLRRDNPNVNYTIYEQIN